MKKKLLKIGEWTIVIVVGQIVLVLLAIYFKFVFLPLMDWFLMGLRK